MEEKKFMNKKEWIKFVAEKYEMSQVQVKGALELVLEGLKDALEVCDQVKFLGELDIKVKEVPERSYQNPQNREEVLTVPAHNKVTCKMGSYFQEIV